MKQIVVQKELNYLVDKNNELVRSDVEKILSVKMMYYF
jgi:hypothetical protein